MSTGSAFNSTSLLKSLWLNVPTIEQVKKSGRKKKLLKKDKKLQTICKLGADFLTLESKACMLLS